MSRLDSASSTACSAWTRVDCNDPGSRLRGELIRRGSQRCCSELGHLILQHALEGLGPRDAVALRVVDADHAQEVENPVSTDSAIVCLPITRPML